MPKTKDDDDNNGKDEHWHLDKRVPLALISALVIQAFGAIWWGGQLDSRVETLERLAVKNGNIESRLARIEESQSWLKGILQRIETKLVK